MLIGTLLIDPDDFQYHSIDKPANINRAVDMASIWLRECLSHHECHKEPIPYHPTRLLHVGEQSSYIKLIITAMWQPKRCYLTLSHRWDSGDYPKLTSSTIDEFQRKIEVSTLPLTFQDAIDVTRRLGVNYLWIDSLCIIQDEPDRTDWLYESPKMCDIYSNALLNLSATGTSTSSSSMFYERDLRSLTPGLIEVELDHQIRQYRVVDGSMWEDEVTKASLNNRAWVFQERLLARRVLHFGKRQLAWECCELNATETFPKGLPGTFVDPLRKPQLGLVLQKCNWPISPEIRQRAYGWWRDMVENYSRCSLTDPGDKLIALSGVAERVKHSTCDDYMAGMWALTIAYDLPWWREEHDRERFQHLCLPYRAPSWSWASVEGEIHFPEMLGGAYERLIRVANASFVYQHGSVSTGGLIEGSISIECKLHAVSFVNITQDLVFTHLVLNERIFDVTGDQAIDFLHHEVPDSEILAWNDMHEIYCVACCATRQMIFGILLHYSGVGQAFFRVGSFVIRAREQGDWEEVWEMEGKHDGGEMESFKGEELFRALRFGLPSRGTLPCDSYDEEKEVYCVRIT